MKYNFTFHEVLLGLTTVVAWADGENQQSEIDTRVTMILKEGITNDEFNAFKKKYEEINSLEFTFQESLEALQDMSTEKKAKALAWMWEVANVGTTDEEDMVDLSHLEIVEDWQKKKDYVGLEELAWINRAKKELKLSVDEIKAAFEAIPAAKRI